MPYRLFMYEFPPLGLLKVICALTCLPRTSPRASLVVRKVQVSPIVCMNSNNCDLHFVQIRDAPKRCKGGLLWDAIILRCILAFGAARKTRPPTRQQRKNMQGVADELIRDINRDRELAAGHPVCARRPA